MAEIGWWVCSTQANFNGLHVLASLLNRGQPNLFINIQQRAPPTFGWVAITLGIGPHSNFCFFFVIFIMVPCNRVSLVHILNISYHTLSNRITRICPYGAMFLKDGAMFLKVPNFHSLQVTNSPQHQLKWYFVGKLSTCLPYFVWVAAMCCPCGEKQKNG